MATDKIVSVGDIVYFGFNNKAEHVKHEVISVNESRRANGVWEIERPNYFSISVKQLTTV